MERGSFLFFRTIIRPSFMFEWRDRDVNKEGGRVVIRSKKTYVGLGLRRHPFLRDVLLLFILGPDERF